MSLKKFIAFLVEEDGRSRQIVNGIVTSLTTPKQLPQMPDGNQDISLGWERSMLDHGTTVNFGLPLGFVLEARKILANDFYKFNSDRKLFLLLKKLTYEFTATTYKEYYKQYYKGLLDFSRAEDNQGEYRFEIPIMSSSLQKLMKADETTKFDIPLDGDAKNIVMDGMFIQGAFNWFMPSFESLAGGYPGLFQLNNDNPIPGLAIFDVQMTIQPSPAAPTIANLEYFAETTQDIAGVAVTGLITDLNSLGASGPLSVLLYVFNVPTDTLRLTIDLTPGDPYPQNYNLVINETFDLLEGDRIFLRSNSHFEGEGNLRLSAKSKPLPSVVQAFTIYDLGRKLVEKITGNADNFEAPFVQDSGILITSFDGVRSITGASVKTSWSDYKRAVQAYFMASVQITDKVRIASRVDAYVPASVTPAIDLGIIKKFKCSTATDLLYTSVKVGHAEQQVEDTNGRFSFNGWHIYNSPIKSIPSKELDLTSPWKADPYEIEQTRANYEGKTTTDKTTDNDIVAIAGKPDPAGNSFDTTATFQADGAPFAPGAPFLSIVAPSPLIRAGMTIRITGSALNDGNYTVAGAATWFFGQLITLNEPVVNEASVVITIEIVEGQYYTLDRDTAVTQLTSPDDVEQDIKDTVYNIPLTPKRLLMVHARWLAGIFNGYAPGVLKFENTNRNKELIAGGITEKADVPIGNLGNPLFIPKYFDFETLAPTDMSEIMEDNPTPTFSFTHDDNQYTGFFILGGIAATTLEEQVFKLLVSPDSDLLNLI